MKVGIIGATGYTGLELVKILSIHPKFEISYVANSEGSTSLSKLHPSLKGICDLEVKKADTNDIINSCELAFLALPHKASMGLAKELIAGGVKVVDLSADYRLELDTYEEHYCPHIDKENLPNAVYGLPEFYSKEIKNANLVANPGCYPTATLLGIIPFVKYIQDQSSLFVDAKSGVSGAGKKLSETTHYCTINENLFAYNPFKHRHAPEIKEKISKVTNKNLNINFVPHLLPATRGMLCSIYASLSQEINAKEVLEEFYKNSKFVRIFDNPVDIKSSSGTNFCDIFATTNGKDLFVSSSIDNLLRGASSQAVVNANLMYGFEEDYGIPKFAYVP
ncbi:N-acetyl-gamma-glutamyl-phosphate reductase [Arcobacter sp. FWKO B]|nr:N-acetyl-gamma-glutamyl-phosphate reductase [Arcobacter sp. FWKO B]